MGNLKEEAAPSKLKAIEEQKMNKVFKGVNMYVKPAVQAEFMNKHNVKQDTMKQVIAKKRQKLKLYMREFWESDPYGYIDYLRVKLKCIRVTGDARSSKQTRPAKTSHHLDPSSKGDKYGRRKPMKNARDAEDEEARTRFNDLMAYLADYRASICYEPLGYIPNGRRRKDEQMDKDTEERFRAKHLFDWFTNRKGQEKVKPTYDTRGNVIVDRIGNI